MGRDGSGTLAVIETAYMLVRETAGNLSLFDVVSILNALAVSQDAHDRGNATYQAAPDPQQCPYSRAEQHSAMIVLVPTHCRSVFDNL